MDMRGLGQPSLLAWENGASCISGRKDTEKQRAEVTWFVSDFSIS